jgi:methionyl-tRNA formyltransferase
MKTKIIFFGNGPLADYSKAVLEKNFEIIFHAKTKEDLETVKTLKAENPELKGVLASFGVMIKSDVLDLFEPEGILNIHPSLLPKYRGSSPIETAILNGDKEFSVSIMKLVKAMDAGPIYFQKTLKFDESYPEKETIYKALSETGANWLVENLENLPAPTEQDNTKASFTAKFDKSMSPLKPETKSAEELLNEVRAFKGFPKSKHDFFGLDCIVLSAHISETEDSKLSLKCVDDKYLIIDAIQPAGRKAMDAKSFLNGYCK